MAFKDFPSTLQVKVMETSELVQAGGVQVAKSLDLAYMQLLVFINGALAGTEKLRIKVFADQLMATSPLATSQYSALSQISNIGTYWIGRLLFTFNGEQLNQNLKYWVGVESSGYTRNGSTFFIGLALDYAFAQVNQQSALWMAIYGNRWLG